MKGYLINSRSFLEKILPCFGLVIVTISIALEASLRYGFSYAILGMEEVTILIGMWVYFLGTALTTREKQHITVNILDSITLPVRIRLAMERIVEMIGFTVCLVFAYFLFQYSGDTVKAGIIIEPLNWPRAILSGGVFVGLVLMSVEYIKQFITGIQQGKKI